MAKNHPLDAIPLREAFAAIIPAIISSIGTHDLVLLGENSHGVSEFSALKVAIIQALHRDHGFSVVAFESGLMECFHADNAIAETAPREALASALYPMWRTDHVARLMAIMATQRNTAHPLRLAGIDTRPMSNSAGYLQTGIAGMDTELGARVAHTEQRIKRLARRGPIGSEEDAAEFHRSHEADRATYQEAVARLGAIADAQRSPAQHVMLRTLAARLGLLDVLLRQEEYYTYREQWMADNIAWLAHEMYPGQRIVVWAHNEHIRRGHPAAAGEPTMHDLLPPDLRKRTYALGMYMHGGRAVWNSRVEYTIEPAAGHTLEARLGAAEAITFTDLRAPRAEPLHWLNAPCTAMSWGGTSGGGCACVAVRRHCGVRHGDAPGVRGVTGGNATPGELTAGMHGPVS